MARIEHLTDKQLARFPEFVDKWTRIGLSTEPADRPRAEAAILAMYKQAGLPKPEIVWCGSPMGNALAWASVRASVRDSVGASVGASVWASVRDSVGASVWASVGASVWASVGGVRDSVRDSVGDSVGASVGASVWASVRDSVGASVGASVWASVGGGQRAGQRGGQRAGQRGGQRAGQRAGQPACGTQRAGQRVRDSVRASVRDSVRASVWASVRASVYGQHDAHWLGYYDFFREAVGMTEETQKAMPLTQLAQSAGWAIPCEHICFVSERHTTLERDDKGRLHCLTGPAVRYPDGWSIYAVHGVRVPENVVTRPEQITVTAINAERNSEIKRVMIERFGWDRWSTECGAVVIDHDDRWGTLKRADDMLFLEVVNGSAEPDGSFRRYVLPIDDECRPLPDPESGDDEFGEPQELTALNAVASTYGMTGKEYAGLHVRT